MLVDKQLPSLVGGVSQQPATVRLSSQAEEIKNTWLSVAHGAQKRPPSINIAKLTSDQLDNAYLHTINRDAEERYCVILQPTGIRVFDLLGDEKTVTMSSPTSADIDEFFENEGSDIPLRGFFRLNSVLTAMVNAATSNTFDTNVLWMRWDTAPSFSQFLSFFEDGAKGLVYIDEPTNITILVGAASKTVNTGNNTVGNLSTFESQGTLGGMLFKVSNSNDANDGGFAAAKGSAPVTDDVFCYFGSGGGVGDLTYVGTLSQLTVAAASEPIAGAGEAALGYLDSPNPVADYVAVTVADYTFILNRNQIVRMGDSDDDASGGSTAAQPLHHWTMIPRYDGAQADDPVKLGAGGFRGQRARQNQYAANPSGGTLAGTVQTFQDLPTDATSGDIYLVKGAADSGFANYYVRSQGDNVWNETVAPGLKNRIDANTMPHALVRKADGTFEFGPFSWADRKVGDETTNPNPYFVGREIRDIFWYKNRFGVAVEEGVCLTRVSDFGNFYRLTVVDVLADDRIDVQASETKVTKINFAVPFDGRIVLFSDQTQLRLNHGVEGLTPGNCTVDVVTNYKMVPNVRPYALGADVYFAQQNGDHAAIREYFVAPDSQINDAANITGHVPRYIPSGLSRIIGSDSHDFIAVLPGEPQDASSELFLYQFHWVSETEKAQSAWNRWDFSSQSGIVSADVLDNAIILIVVRDDGTYLESVELPTANDTSLSMLDRADSVTGSYHAGNDETTWTLAYPVTGDDRDDFMIVRSADGRIITDDPADFTWASDTSVKLDGDHSVDSVYGLLYEWRYEFSEQFARNQQEVPMLNGKLLLREWTVHFEGTATFQIDVRPYGAATSVERIVPAQTASGGNLTAGLEHFVDNAPVFADGQHTFGVFGESNEAIVALVDRSPYSLTFTQAEYEGFYHKRSRTI